MDVDAPAAAVEVFIDDPSADVAVASGLVPGGWDAFSWSWSSLWGL